jgi:hypothetical protein
MPTLVYTDLALSASPAAFTELTVVALAMLVAAGGQADAPRTARWDRGPRIPGTLGLNDPLRNQLIMSHARREQ